MSDAKKFTKDAASQIQESSRDAPLLFVIIVIVLFSMEWAT